MLLVLNFFAANSFGTKLRVDDDDDDDDDAASGDEPAATAAAPRDGVDLLPNVVGQKMRLRRSIVVVHLILLFVFGV